MKIYIAAPYAARDQVRRYAKQLEEVGDYECTSRWCWPNHELKDGTVGAANAFSDDQVAAHAGQDLYDIGRSDTLILLTESVAECNGWPSTTGGRHVETGYALSLGKRVIVVGEPENVFHKLAHVQRCPTWEGVLNQLIKEQKLAEQWSRKEWS